MTMELVENAVSLSSSPLFLLSVLLLLLLLCAHRRAACNINVIIFRRVVVDTAI